MDDLLRLTQNLVLILLIAGVLAAIWAGITSLYARELDRRIAILEAARLGGRRADKE